jgi:hypothetical protein
MAINYHNGGRLKGINYIVSKEKKEGYMKGSKLRMIHFVFVVVIFVRMLQFCLVAAVEKASEKIIALVREFSDD